MKNKGLKFGVILLIAIFLIIVIIINKDSIIKNVNKDSQKSALESNVTYLIEEVDIKEDYIIACVTFEDKINGITEIETPEQHKIQMIDKRKVAIDYKFGFGESVIFKVKSANQQTTELQVDIDGFVKEGEEKSILKGIEKINSSGYYDISVNGITYKLHVYYYEESQNWTENMIFGDANDIGTASSNASRMVVVKVDGDLNINSGVTVSPYSSYYGGPKGFLIYCTGTLTNNGCIQNNYGAKAAGENVYLWRNLDLKYEYVPATGAAGATAGKTNTGTRNIIINGTNGNNATTSTIKSSSGVKRATAGGGRGGLAICNSEYYQSSSAGGIGTSYGAGGGGGGVSRHSNSGNITPSNGINTIGGNGTIRDGSYNVYKCAAGGGAGNNPGTGLKSRDGVSAQNGGTGTGGLLIIYCKELVVNVGSSIVAKGQSGGNAVGGGGTGNNGSAASGGGGSGGGSINIFVEEINVTEGSIGTYINVSGGAGGIASGGTYNAKGGAGGTGSCNIGYIKTGNYVPYYSNN